MTTPLDRYVDREGQSYSVWHDGLCIDYDGLCIDWTPSPSDTQLPRLPGFVEVRSTNFCHSSPSRLYPTHMFSRLAGPEQDAGEADGQEAEPRMNTMVDLNLPTVINGRFSCRDHNFTDLRGGPAAVNGSYVVSGNPLACLDGIAEVITHRFVHLCAVSNSSTADPKASDFTFADIHRQLKCMFGDIVMRVDVSTSMNGILDLLLIEKWTGKLAFMMVMDDTADHDRFNEAAQVSDIINRYRGCGRIGLMKAHLELSRLAETCKHLTLDNIIGTRHG